MRAPLRPATRRRLHDALAPDAAGVLPFAEAVALQVAHPLGGDGHDDAVREIAVAGALARILGLVVRPPTADAETDAAREAAAAALADDVPLLSACYQNLDLLPAVDAASDAVALLVVRALALLEARHPSAPVA